MAMVNRSMTKPAGNEARTAGSVVGNVNMNSPAMLFDKEHQAEFMWIPSKTWNFYELLLKRLNLTPTQAVLAP